MSRKRLRGNKDDSKPQKMKKTDCFENDQIFPIEEIFARLPNLSENIFGRLDNRSLVSCREVSKIWAEYVDSQRVYWIRQILKCNPPQSKFHGEWKIVLEKTPIETLKKFARYVLETSLEVSPIHVAGGLGDVELFKSIKEKTGLNENSEDNKGMTAFHLAAYNNRLSLCEVIIEQLQDKNPGNCHGLTPLHYAAWGGHLEICKLIMTSVQDKNPGNKKGCTPLHFAASKGHYNVCNLLLDIVDDKNLRNINGSTPLHGASYYGHVNICQLIYEKIADSGLLLRSSKSVKKVYGVNPGNNKGVTPLHLAAKKGQLDVCKFLCSKLQDKNPKCNGEKTPMDLAYSNKHWKIVRFLMDENNLA